jgi:hypothetical protein
LNYIGLFGTFFFSEPVHIFLKIIYGLFKKTIKNDSHVIYDAIKWNLENINETLNVRKEWFKIKESKR